MTRWWQWMICGSLIAFAIAHVGDGEWLWAAINLAVGGGSAAWYHVRDSRLDKELGAEL